MKAQTRGYERSAPARYGATVAGAILAAAVVFLFLAAATSDGSGRVERFERWTSGPNQLIDDGRGITFPVGPRPSLLLHTIADGGPAYALLTFEAYLRDPLSPEAGLIYGAGGDLADFRAYDFSGQVARTGWNPIEISADEALGLGDAETVGLSLASLSGPNVMGVRGAALRTVSLGGRLRQMGAALVRHEPLAARSMNFSPSPKIAGRGFNFILWCALALSCLLLLARRLLLGGRLPLLSHLGASVLALVVLADLRNSVDYFQNARTAVERRANAPDTIAYLADLEAPFPWFAESVDYLRKWGERSPGKRYYLHVSGSYFAPQALDRAEYYLLPVRRAANLVEADVVLIHALPEAPFEASRGWRRREPLPGGVAVYERRFGRRR